MSNASRRSIASRVRSIPARRGSVYVVVLGLSTLVTILAIGAIGAGLAQRHSSESLKDADDARLYAATAVDLGRLSISQDTTWRTDNAAGTWIAAMTLGSGTCGLNVSDTTDNKLSIRPYDPVLLTGSGNKGRSKQMLQTTLIANPTPLDALAYALFVPGMLHVTGGATCIVPGSTIATSGTYQSEGILLGSSKCFTASGTGSTSGSTSLLFGGCALPGGGVEAMYVALGTAISPGNTLQQVVLSPGYNPYGTPNADGVYVINATTDLTIQNCRINGTLVVVDPGHNVKFNNTVLIQPARADYPAMIIDGNVQFNYTTNGTSLSESANSANFNPPGAPYNGGTNATMTDTYPSMISGLVDIKGTVAFNGAGSLIHGAVICESNATNNAVAINANDEIDYDPSLYTNPPQGFTKSVNMVPQAGTWIRVTN